MAYKFQTGEARLSGSLVREGAIDFKDSAGVEFNLRLGANDGIVDVARHNGSDEGLKLAGTLVTSTAAELNLLDTAAAGTVVNSKAVIYSAGGVVQGTDFKGPDGFDIGNASNADAMNFGAAEITVKDGVDFSVATVGGFNYGGAAVTSTAAELNLLDTAAAGTVVNSKAVIYSNAGAVNGTSLTSSTGITGSSLQIASFGVTNTGYVTIPKLAAELDADSENIININDLGVAGAADLFGNVAIGNATSDDLTVTARVDSDFVPKTDSARDLGSTALRWRTIYVDSIVGADITLDVESYGGAPLGTTISASTDLALLAASSTSYTLPAASAGKTLHVKLSGSIHTATISAATGDSLEDGSSIVLESTGSAVTLVCYDATHWFII